MDKPLKVKTRDPRLRSDVEADVTTRAGAHPHPFIRKLQQTCPLAREEEEAILRAAAREMEFGPDEDLVRDGEHIVPPVLHCSACSGELEFDDVPDRYFAFLKKD